MLSSIAQIDFGFLKRDELNCDDNDGNIQLIRNLWATFFYVFTIIAVLIVFLLCLSEGKWLLQCNAVLHSPAFNVYCVESSFVQHEEFEAEAIVIAIIAVGSTTYLRRSAHTITTFWVRC